MSPLPAAELASALREAAALLVEHAELGIKLYRCDGSVLAELSPPFAAPIAAGLRATAELIVAHRLTSVLGLPVNHDLALAGLVLGRDLGHNR